MKVAAREKFHLMGEGGNQDPGDPGVGKVRGGGGGGRRGGGKGFFSFKQGGELTLDDTVITTTLR